MRVMVLLGVVVGCSAWASENDGGQPNEAATAEASVAPATAVAMTPAAPVDAGVALPVLPIAFDAVTTPWGPGRKLGGELFHSTAAALPDGPGRWSWSGFSLAVGGQYFARGEARDSADFNHAARDESFGIDQRARFTVRASARERVGVYLEFQDVRAWGSESSTVAVMPNTGLHQGFVDLKAGWLSVRAGRQELAYGEERLVGSLDWSQIGRAFDGVFVRVAPSATMSLDGFGFMLKPPAVVTAASDATRFMNSGSYFTGLVGRGRFGKWGVDAYGFGLLEDPGTALTGWAPDNNRFTVGARAFGAVAGLAVVGEAAYQTGRVGVVRETVSAGAFALKATYTLAQLKTAPYLTAEFSGASGDGAPGDGTEHTFHQLFPTGHAHLGFMDYVGWQNVLAVRGTIGFRPLGVHIWLDVHHFENWVPQGAWYAANGTVFIAADPMRTARNMGTELDLSVTVPLIDAVALAGNFSVFVPGPAAASKGANLSSWGFISLRSQF